MSCTKQHSLKHTPNHMIFMFFPFRKESNLNSSRSCTYLGKLPNHGALEIICSYRRNCKPYRHALDEVFINVVHGSSGLEPESEQ